jgi:hypothetical protein
MLRTVWEGVKTLGMILHSVLQSKAFFFHLWSIILNGDVIYWFYDEYIITCDEIIKRNRLVLILMNAVFMFTEVFWVS